MEETKPTSEPTERREMSAEEFIKIWKGEYKGVEGYEGFYKRGEFRFGSFEEKEDGELHVFFSEIKVAEKINIEKEVSPLPSVHLVNAQISNLSIDNSTTGYFYISDNSTTGDFYISDNSTTGYFYFYNSTTGNFNIYNSTTGNFNIYNSTTGDFYISDNSTTRNLIVSKSKIASLFIDNSKTGKVEIRDNSHLGNFRCKLPLDHPTQLFFRNVTVSKLDLNDTIIPEFATLSISETNINEGTLVNCCNYGTLFFSDINPLKKWEGFEKNKPNRTIRNKVTRKYQFKEINRPSTFRLADSELGSLQFINCDLSQFDHFEFRNAKLLNIFVAGSQMPEAEAFRLPGDEQPPHLVAEQKRLAFGQFKKIYEQQGDRAGSLKYLAYEMGAYREQLKIEKNELPYFSKKRWDNRWERLILFLNRISTNYGNNWMRGAAVTFLVIGIAFGGYCFLLGYRPGSDISKFFELVSFAPQYLNPFRDEDSGQFFELLKEDGINKINGTARMWDYLWRIIIAYLVYQTIQAFRKLGKSSG